MGDPARRRLLINSDRQLTHLSADLKNCYEQCNITFLYHKLFNSLLDIGESLGQSKHMIFQEMKGQTSDFERMRPRLHLSWAFQESRIV
jgi:hypothetical protein